MLTRLRVDGFKNLKDVDLRFGPFTCIAGANGVGKSNAFDAILFLSALASDSLTEAALSVRGSGALGGDPRGIFYRGGGTAGARILLRVEMILPASAVDALGQVAKAATTFVEYTLELRLRVPENDGPGPEVMVEREELVPIKIGDARKHLRFEQSASWRKSAVRGKRGSPFISTETVDGAARVKRHQDGGPGRTAELAAASLPRTVLSSATATESPTALVAKREMESWRLLQLEPSRLRSPDEYHAPTSIDESGLHLPATLYRLDGADLPSEKGATLATLANRLNELVRDTRGLRIDRDDARRRTTLYLLDRSGQEYAARALSDGTLRFLALLTLDLDPEVNSLLCLEEPENGIHPEHVETILGVLEGMATDTSDAIGEGNPLRQVIINTHSPLVVGATRPDDLIIVDLEARPVDGGVARVPTFRASAKTWRTEAGGLPIAPVKLKRYLGASPRQRSPDDQRTADVVLQPSLPFTLV